MGVIIIGPDPLTHILLIILIQLLGNHIQNFDLVGSLISFLKPKQLPGGVATANLHLYAVNNAHPDIWRPKAKFWPNLSLINFFNLNNFQGVWL